MEKPLDIAWVGLKVGWGRISENQQCKVSTVN